MPAVTSLVLEDLGIPVPFREVCAAINWTLDGASPTSTRAGLERFGITADVRLEAPHVAVDLVPSIVVHHGVIDGPERWPELTDEELDAATMALGVSADEVAEEAARSGSPGTPQWHSVYLRAADGNQRQLIDPVGGYGWWHRRALLGLMNEQPVPARITAWRGMAERSAAHFGRGLGIDEELVAELAAEADEWQRLAQIEATLEHADHLVDVGAIASDEAEGVVLGMLERPPSRCSRRHRWSYEPIVDDVGAAYGLRLIVIAGTAETPSMIHNALAAGGERASGRAPGGA